MLLSWLEAVPVGLVSLVWLVVPGLLITYGIGLRGIAAAGMAPVVTIALVATVAVVAAKLGIAWSLPMVLIVCLVVGGGTAVGGYLLRRRMPARAADARGVTGIALGGLVPALLLGAITIVLGLRRPDQLSQTFDAVFHYNAVALILDTHNGSSLPLATLGTPGLPGAFYPAAWHDLTSLVVLTTHSSIPLAANMFSAVIVIVLWPLSCVLLARQIFGQSRAALAVTALVSIGFTDFPWGLLGFGVLWPNLLAMAMAPAAMAVVLSITGLATDDAIGRGRAWLLLPVVVVAGGFAQPNELFSVAALSLFPIAVAVLKRAWRLRAAGRSMRGALEILVTVVVIGGGWAWAATTPMLALERTFPWPAFESPAQATGQVLLNAASGPIPTNGFNALWVLSALVVIGMALCRRYPYLRWVVVGYAVSGALYVLTAAINRPDTQKFVGYWYNDAYRLASMLPITAVPLAVAAVVYLADRAREVSGGAEWARRLASSRPLRTRTAVATVLTLLLVLLTKGLYVGNHVATLTYRRSDTLTGSNQEGWLVDPAAQAFFARIKNDIPANSVVADNPWDGSSLLWALADRRTLFPHLVIGTTADQRFLAVHLSDAATDPQVCQVADRLHVGYLLIGDGRFWVTDARIKQYPGLADPGQNSAFQLVDSAGPMKLYRLTACSN